MQVMPNSIELENVVFKYTDDLVLDAISLNIEQGDYVGIVGPNGGGKTTLIKLILGLITPTSGTIKVLGQETRHSRDKFSIGYVPQRISIQNFPGTVREVVESGRTAQIGLLRRFGTADKKAVEDALKITETSHLQNRLIATLSGGERQRVFIARALASEPKILILDEPVVGVDIASQDRFYDFLRTLNHDLGLTILFISHDVEIITNQAKSILCLNHRLVCHTTPKEFVKGHFLEDLYGTKMHHLHHHEGHGHTNHDHA